ncbi:energy transducer TonB [Pararcticibacter amylolyticus]|uniref:Energy transducer TonB n=1 Tax=Pararcticibacter amylolyticus TaxID=2173175 RepID=A0A2U2PGQ5_9SPHI|nr:energy transducer TonB [Pararcticibacter amylolyticus]PWG80514.1 energy transducer TonB [Pararcticibacter amylolyticus]
MQYQEENNYPKAFLISGVMMGLLIAISYFIVFGMQAPQEVGTGGIVVNYGTVEEGMGDDFMSIEEPSVDPNANNTPPDKVLPNTETQPVPSAESNEKTVVTQEVEDAPEVSVPKKATSAPVASTATTPPKESKPTVNQNALYKGKKSTGTGMGDGTGSTPGNQGDPDGDPLASNYGSGGSGFGNVKLTLANRRFLNLPRINDQGQQSGKIYVEIRVDKSGEVVYARAGVRGTTLSDQNLWRKCEQAVMGAKLNQLESAPDVQIGVVVFNFKVK